MPGTITIAPPELLQIPIALLLESEHNPRTRFDPSELQELADSLKASGQLTPILVRPHPRKAGSYEIAAGACRRRAAEFAGLLSLSATVRDLDDATFVEFVNVENRQRNNLEPLDEAKGFADWMKTAGLDVAQIAARIGLSEKYVYDRLKLLQLIKPAQQLLSDRVITVGHAILLSRLSKDDQARAIGDNDHRTGQLAGLFTADYAGEDGTELDFPEERRKPVSVREFQSWINDHVRFVPEREDLANLFPETEAALAAAKEEDLTVVNITHDYRVQDDAKDANGKRTYGAQSWKRADGEANSKACEFSLLGVVVAGPGRGEAFRVCVNKDKCAVHWAAEKRKKAKAKKESAATGKTSWQVEQERQNLAREQREAENARWKKASPAIYAALEAKIAKAATGPTGQLAQLIFKACAGYGAKAGKPSGRTADDVVRHAALLVISQSFATSWTLSESIAASVKPFGIDARKLVDEIAPNPAPKKTVKTDASPNPKKKLAGDVRRAAAKKKAAKKPAKRAARVPEFDEGDDDDE